MFDRRSGFYKIGMSNNPRYREKTLQAQIPLVDILNAWAGTRKDEGYLHKFFAKKRLRGEWFELADYDLEEIRWHFFDRKQLKSGKTEYQEYEEELAQHEEAKQQEDQKDMAQAWHSEDLGFSGDALDFAVEGFGLEF